MNTASTKASGEDATPVESSSEGIDEPPSQGAAVGLAPSQPRLPDPDVIGKKAKQDSAGIFHQHAAFHRSGKAPEGSAPPPPGPYDPVLLWNWRDLSRARYDYPCCLTPDRDRFVQPLKDLVDGIMAEAGTDDAGQVFKRHAMRLEAGIKTCARDHPRETLQALAERVARDLAASVAASDGKQNQLRANLAKAAARLNLAAPLVGCEADTARRLFKAAALWHWRRRAAAMADDLEALRDRVAALLLSDEAQSAEAASPERLGRSFGSDDMDSDALAKIVASSHTNEALPAARRLRLHETLAILDRYRPLWGGDSESDSPFDVCATAALGEVAQLVQARIDAVTELFRAVWVARLEVEGKYQEAAHDRYFAQFNFSHLRAAEQAFCPPVLVVSTAQELEGTAYSDLLDLLQSDAPVKLLVEVDRAITHDGTLPGHYARAVAALATSAAALGSAYVAQTPVSHVRVLEENLIGAFRWEGPALLCVYTGTGDNSSGSRFVEAASAMESRLWPVFEHDPSKGARRADCVSLQSNPSVEADWPIEAVDCAESGGADTVFACAFTAGEFLLTDPEWHQDFWPVDAAEWHEGMLPLAEFLELTPDMAASRVPYLTAVDANGAVLRMLATRRVVDAARKTLRSWRNLQELCGIRDSFAEAQVAAERQRFEEAKASEIEKLARQYEDKLDQHVDELTHEIVRRIASQIMGGEIAPITVSIGPKRSATAAPPPPLEEAQPAPGDAEPDEDEPAALEGPYIDTPLCTSCNECTKINSRLFAYNENKQAFIKDLSAGTYRDLVMAAENCPVKIIHPGKPTNPDEPDLDALVKRAAPFL